MSLTFTKSSCVMIFTCRRIFHKYFVSSKSVEHHLLFARCAHSQCLFGEYVLTLDDYPFLFRHINSSLYKSQVILPLWLLSTVYHFLFSKPDSDMACAFPQLVSFQSKSYFRFTCLDNLKKMKLEEQ